MFLAIGSVYHCQEDVDRTVTDRELVRTVSIRAPTKDLLVQRMTEMEIEISKEMDAILLRGEIEESEIVVYPYMTWTHTLQVQHHIDLVEMNLLKLESDEWQSYMKFGPVEALRNLRAEIEDELTERSEWLAQLESGGERMSTEEDARVVARNMKAV